MNFHACPKTGVIYDDNGHSIHQVPEHALDDFRRSASQYGIRLLDDVPAPRPAPAPKAPQPKVK